METELEKTKKDEIFNGWRTTVLVIKNLQVRGWKENAQPH